MKTNQNKLFSKISFLAGKKTIPINTIRACFKKTFSVQPFFKIKKLLYGHWTEIDVLLILIWFILFLDLSMLDWPAWITLPPGCVVGGKDLIGLIITGGAQACTYHLPGSGRIDWYHLCQYKHCPANHKALLPWSDDRIREDIKYFMFNFFCVLFTISFDHLWMIYCNGHLQARTR